MKNYEKCGFCEKPLNGRSDYLCGSCREQYDDDVRSDMVWESTNDCLDIEIDEKEAERRQKEWEEEILHQKMMDIEFPGV